MLTIKKIDNKIIIRRVVVVFLSSMLLLSLSYFLFSPVIIGAAGVSSTGTATPTLTVTKEVNVSSPGVVALTPSIAGITGSPSGAPSSGTASFTVQTSSQSGFNMTLYAGANPALATGAYTFADYTNVAVASPDFTWQNPSSGTTSFGFSIGADTATNAVLKFRNSGASCGTGVVNSTTNCIFTLRGYTSGNPLPVISTSSQTSGAGSTEQVKFFASFYNPSLSTSIPADSYTATITATVASN